jgi:AraC family transcriptional regulator
MKEELTVQIQIYIEKNIMKPITLQQLSSTLNYSPYYISRVFKEITGQNIFEYIRRIRLTHAAKVLRDQQVKVLDVALDFMFDSHEGFTRAFSKTFDITPKSYQQSPHPIQYFIPYLIEIKRKEVKKMEAKAIFVQIIERPKRKAIIKRATTATEYFTYCEEVGCDVWGILTSIKEALNEPMGMWLSNQMMKPNTSLYVQGVEVPDTYQGIIPEGFDVIDLPVCELVLFQGEPYEDTDFRNQIGFVMESIEKYNPKVYGFTYDPNGYRFQYEPQGYRGYIEGRVIKR